jgi:hypothetical protein
MGIKDIYDRAKEAAEMAQSFAKASVKHAKGGFATLSEKQRKERMDICQGCEFINNNNPDNPRCHKCSCFLTIKVGWPAEECPIGKWKETAPDTTEPWKRPRGRCGGCGKR